MDKPLYKLTDSYVAIHALLDMEYQPEGIEQTLATIQDDIENKVENLTRIILEANATATAIKQEEERLAKRRQSLDNTAKWIKQYMLTEMTKCNILKVKRELFTVTVQANPISCEVVDPHAIPEEYNKVFVEPDKQAIISHFKDTGEVVPGVSMITDKKHIVIR